MKRIEVTIDPVESVLFTYKDSGGIRLDIDGQSYGEVISFAIERSDLFDGAKAVVVYEE